MVTSQKKNRERIRTNNNIGYVSKKMRALW